jgi:betaine reductase
VGCCRRAHDTDENLEAGVMLENLACKASGVCPCCTSSGMRHRPADVDFVVECSEEAVGDALQRGGGNMAKAVAEIAECVNASGFDVRGFCAGPVASVITAAGMVASGVRANVVVLSGGSVPKLYMNARDHIKKGLTPLENCIGSFALLLTPDDGQTPVLRLDGIGKHSVGAGASPQAITSALTFEPLSRVGLKLTDVDKYAPELHNAEITGPAGAGNVPEANYKMIAALSVMKGEIARGDIPAFAAQRGMPGFVPTQGHIPSGVPYVGHALEALKSGDIKRAMIIGKGSLFLGRLTNLADGASFILVGPGAGAAAEAGGISRSDVTEMLLAALGDVAANLRKSEGRAPWLDRKTSAPSSARPLRIWWRVRAAAGRLVAWGSWPPAESTRRGSSSPPRPRPCGRTPRSPWWAWGRGRPDLRPRAWNGSKRATEAARWRRPWRRPWTRGLSRARWPCTIPSPWASPRWAGCWRRARARPCSWPPARA